MVKIRLSVQEMEKFRQYVRDPHGDEEARRSWNRFICALDKALGEHVLHWICHRWCDVGYIHAILFHDCELDSETLSKAWNPRCGGKVLCARTASNAAVGE